MPIAARAYANTADVIVVWESDRIAGCLGFAIQRQDQSGGDPVYLPTYMPFAPDPAASPTHLRRRARAASRRTCGRSSATSGPTAMRAGWPARNTACFP
ncbi:MAG: hypothetical protein ACR2FU_04775 [Streptosporangiaceae bacterium]